MIIKKGRVIPPKMYSQRKNGQHLGILLLFRKNIWGFFLYFSKNILGFFCFLTKKIWGFRINIVNLHPINRIDYGKSF